jgi:hypothetical protein
MEYLVAADPVKARKTLGGQQIKNGSGKTPGPIEAIWQPRPLNPFTSPIRLNIEPPLVR